MAYQKFKITVDTRANDDAGDSLGLTVDYETFPHDEPLGPADWADMATLIDSETFEDGRFRLLIFERFGSHYDRSAETTVPTVETVTVELVERGEEG